MALSLSFGSRFGQFEIVGLLGVGGMGEVYRARDTVLGREVALKILPDAFADDPERTARVDREARALAALNHPFIAAIHGIEVADGRRALVLELVDGPTLAERLERSALPIDQVLPVAAQIAEALEFAHEHGIVHRDLKPANIKLRADGMVKVLDFGLARVLEKPNAGSGSWPATGGSPVDTQVGQIVGTAAYMSPEQARGKPVDKRTDIWAFGCVLYEMLSGQPAFVGEDNSETMARVIEREPDWQLLSEVPAPLRRLVRRCLRKNPRERLRDIGDGRLELAEALAPQAEDAARGLAARSGSRVLVVAAALGGVVLGGLAAWLLRPDAPAVVSDDVPVVRTGTEIDLAAHAPLALDSVAAASGIEATLIDVAPDGRTIAYVGMTGETSQLFLRSLDSFDIVPLPGTEGALYPFFAPDGRSIGFLTNNQVKSHSLTTGTSRTIGDLVTPVAATWLSDDSIFVAWDEGRRLARVDASGGPAEVLGVVRDDYRYGRVSPDGRHALVTQLGEGSSADYARILLLDLSTNEAFPLGLNGYGARLSPSGYLTFGRAGTAFAARFDLAQRTVVGEPMPIAADVRMNAVFAHIQLAVADSGLMIFVPGGDVAMASPAWVSREGEVEFLPLEPRVYGKFDLSPDGRRLALQVADNRDYILIYDIERGISRRLATDGVAGYPKWSPTGDRLAYTIPAGPQAHRLAVVRPDSDRPAAIVAESSDRMTASAWSPDERQLTYYEFPSDRIGVVSLDGDAAADVSYLDIAGGQHDVTADGRWLVYSVGGIWVRPLPLDERAYQIDEEGVEPRWCEACGEMIYRVGNRWFAVAIELGDRVEWMPPREIMRTEFNDTPGPSWLPSADGERILVLKRREDRPRTQLRVIQGWQAALASP